MTFDRKKYYQDNKENFKKKRKEHYELNKIKTLESQKEWVKNHVEKSREYKRKYKNKNKQISKEYIRNLKISCSCGENEYIALDFHHIKESEKEYHIHTLIHHGYTLEKIKEELDKCEIICANCHRKKHFLKYSKYYNNSKGKYISDIKNNSKCRICSESHWSCLDFHHINSNDKILNIGAMIRDKNYSLDDLKNEINKCEILCVNCHRKTYEV